MPPDKNLRLSLVWRFDTVAGPIGEVWWTWVASDFQGNPVFMRQVNGWFTVFWIAMIPVSLITGWISSVTYVAVLSLWALV